MKNELYKRTILGADPAAGREQPEILYVTEEANGFACFLESPKVGLELLKWFNHGKDAAIEWGVNKARELSGFVVSDGRKRP